MSIPLFKVHMPAGAGDALEATLASGHLAHGAKVEEFVSPQEAEAVLHREP